MKKMRNKDSCDAIGGELEVGVRVMQGTAEKDSCVRADLGLGGPQLT